MSPLRIVKNPGILRELAKSDEIPESIDEIREQCIVSKGAKINHDEINVLKTKTIALSILFAAVVQISSTPPVNAESLKQHHMPLTINVKQVKITDEDIDQAAKFCLIKEGTIEKEATIHEKPTPAQTIVMATMCN